MYLPSPKNKNKHEEKQKTNMKKKKKNKNKMKKQKNMKKKKNNHNKATSKPAPTAVQTLDGAMACFPGNGIALQDTWSGHGRSTIGKKKENPRKP